MSEGSSRRVKSIYSVISSVNRLEILKILNNKGPMTYSELKAYAGFKSKKESGKFAYHLRKLVRQNLVGLNRSEKKYYITNLGRLIVNLSRQIEEQSMVESGKLYVRTSKQVLEEFNPDKILQSLVREAGMPVELAQKITSEAESRLYKFQTIYLTAQLIRELVNALLLEHGYEEYRQKLTRLGMPVYDVTQLINDSDGRLDGIEGVMAKTSDAVLSEYFLLSKLPKDVVDSHFSGDICLLNVGTWGLMPDDVFVDLDEFKGVEFSDKLLSIPRVGRPSGLYDSITGLLALISLLGKEASKGITLFNFSSYLERHGAMNPAMLSKAFSLIPYLVRNGYSKPLVGFVIDGGYDMGPLLDAYEHYLSITPIPRIALIVKDAKEDAIDRLVSIANRGGRVGLLNDGIRSYMGIKRELDSPPALPSLTIALHSLSLNLPRLAYDANMDESYFRAKLAIALQTCIDALEARKRALLEVLRKGLLPLLSLDKGVLSADYIPMSINLVGLREAIWSLIGEEPPTDDYFALQDKILETASRVVRDRGEGIGICMVNDESSERLARLDVDKFGKGIVMLSGNRMAYSQAPVIDGKGLFDGLVRGLSRADRLLNGGYVVNLKAEGGPIPRLPYVRMAKEMYVCKVCGFRNERDDRCSKCGSTSFLRYSTIGQT